MKHLALAAVSLSVVAASAAGAGRPQDRVTGGEPSGPPDTYVADWDAVGAEALAAAEVAPAEDGVILTYQAIAVHDAVMAAGGAYEPFAVEVDAPDGASPQAAVAAAAHVVLVHYLPDQAASILDPAYEASLGTIPDGDAKTDGIASGEHVAALLIEQRANDGFRPAPACTPPEQPGPGDWIPTAEAPPIGVFLSAMQPFSLGSADQVRPPVRRRSRVTNGHATSARSRSSAQR